MPTGLRMSIVAPLVVTAAGCGAGPAAPQLTTLRLEDVPPELMAIARKELPGIEFDTAWRKASGTYEIRGKAKNGKIREIDVRPDGTVEEVE
ncbi:MAG: hypothetical protein FJ284_01020 [Planctomycetes bacterium]|nr:hypothetical protein [Planctomycetota bacterium]